MKKQERKDETVFREFPVDERTGEAKLGEKDRVPVLPVIAPDWLEL